MIPSLLIPHLPSNDIVELGSEAEFRHQRSSSPQNPHIEQQVPAGHIILLLLVLRPQEPSFDTNNGGGLLFSKGEQEFGAEYSTKQFPLEYALPTPHQRNSEHPELLHIPPSLPHLSEYTAENRLNISGVSLPLRQLQGQQLDYRIYNKRLIY